MWQGKKHVTFLFIYLFFLLFSQAVLRDFLMTPPMVVLATVSSGSHLAHAAPSVLPSIKDIEAEVMGNMWVILHHSTVTKKSQLARIEPGTTNSRRPHLSCLATTSLLT